MDGVCVYSGAGAYAYIYHVLFLIPHGFYFLQLFETLNTFASLVLDNKQNKTKEKKKCRCGKGHIFVVFLCASNRHEYCYVLSDIKLLPRTLLFFLPFFCSPFAISWNMSTTTKSALFFFCSQKWTFADADATISLFVIVYFKYFDSFGGVDDHYHHPLL